MPLLRARREASGGEKRLSTAMSGSAANCKSCPSSFGERAFGGGAPGNCGGGGGGDCGGNDITAAVRAVGLSPACVSANGFLQPKAFGQCSETILGPCWKGFTSWKHAEWNRAIDGPLRPSSDAPRSTRSEENDCPWGS